MTHDTDNYVVEGVTSFREVVDILEAGFKESINVTIEGEVKSSNGVYFGYFEGVGIGGHIEFPTVYDYAGASDALILKQFLAFDKSILKEAHMKPSTFNTFDGLFSKYDTMFSDRVYVNPKKALEILKESPATLLFCMEAALKQMRDFDPDALFCCFVFGATFEAFPDELPERAWIGFDVPNAQWYAFAKTLSLIMNPGDSPRPLSVVDSALVPRLAKAIIECTARGNDALNKS